MVTDTAPYRYPYYHTAQDTPDKVDYERTARSDGSPKDAGASCLQPERSAR